jgi:hypothetical protein
MICLARNNTRQGANETRAIRWASRFESASVGRVVDRKVYALPDVVRQNLPVAGSRRMGNRPEGE